MQPDTPQQPQPATPAPVPASQPVPGVAPVMASDPTTRQTPAVTLSIGDMALADVTASTDAVQSAPKTKASKTDVVQWQAKEYISPDKSPIWYAALGIVVIGLIALDILVLKTFFTVSLLAIVIAAVVIVMHIRPARMINYTLDAEGLRVDDQLYPLSDYRAFGVLHDGKENSIHLIPIKRFRPSLQVYFPVESGETIVDSLGAHLPMEELRLDFVDQIVKFLRL